MHSCSIDGCYNNFHSKHAFPNPSKNRTLFDIWVKLSGNKHLVQEGMTPEKIYTNYRVCSLHFVHQDFGPNKHLKKGVFPSVNLPGNTDLLGLTESLSTKKVLCSTDFKKDDFLNTEANNRLKKTADPQKFMTEEIKLECNYSHEVFKVRTPSKTYGGRSSNLLPLDSPQMSQPSTTRKPSPLTQNLDEDWVPSLNMGHDRCANVIGEDNHNQIKEEIIKVEEIIVDEAKDPSESQLPEIIYFKIVDEDTELNQSGVDSPELLGSNDKDFIVDSNQQLVPESDQLGVDRPEFVFFNEMNQINVEVPFQLGEATEMVPTTEKPEQINEDNKFLVCCKSRICDGLVCVKCGKIYHINCAIQNWQDKVKIIDRTRLVCIEHALSPNTHSEKSVEVAFLRELLREVKEKHALLEQNKTLLEEKVRNLQKKISNKRRRKKPVVTVESKRPA